MHDGDETEQRLDTFNLTDSLNAAIAGDASASTALINADYLLKLSAQGGRLPRRQELPPEAVFTGVVDENVVVIVLSYCWQTAEHPDPDGDTLRDLCLFLWFVHATRHKKRAYKEREKDTWKAKNLHNIGDRKVVVFWDYCSLYQKPRTAFQDDSFNRGLQNVNIWYAHRLTWVVLATQAPAGRKHGYHESGWPFFEFNVSNMIKSSIQVFDLPTAIAHIQHCKESSQAACACLPSADGGIMMDMSWLFDATRKAERKLVMAPPSFDKVVDTKAFTNGADVAFVKRKYAQTFDLVVSNSTTFDFHDMQAVSTNE